MHETMMQMAAVMQG